MNPMTSSPFEPADLLDLRMLPAWVKEPVEAKRYADAEGEHDSERPVQSRRGAPPRRGRRPMPNLGKSRAALRQPTTKAGKHTPGRHQPRHDRDSDGGIRTEGRPAG